MDNVNDLKAGFTADLDEKTANLAERAKTAAKYVKKEANAVAVSAQNNPSGTGAALLLIGAGAFLAGYLLGNSSSQPPRHRYW